MINEYQLKMDSYTLGLRDIATKRSISERNAMEKNKEIIKNNLDEISPLYVVPIRTTGPNRKRIKEAATKYLSHIDKELENEGHERIDKRGRRNQGLTFIANCLLELMADHIENQINQEDYPHQKNLNEMFEEVFSPYIKERRIARDY